MIINKIAGKKNKKPELLAPAGDLQAAMAAINAGADAIYFGGSDFNARHNAKNLRREEMILISRLTKEHQVKTYLVLNTLIKDSEWEVLLENLDFYQTLQVDGLIVTDLGLIYLLQKYYQFPLQTSTQMSVYGLEGVLFFEELGFDRVVCPRELSLEEVKKIKESSQIELKVFIHGALCYSYSGQCLMSSLIGGRSGNRGRCAQPCRKKYQLSDDHHQPLSQGYLLSPKDLNTLADLKAIIDSGVAALKIEGRMKTPEYVFAVSRAYREKIDALWQGRDEIQRISETDLKQVFNRDFTRGHLLGDDQILNWELGKNRGIKIGKVGRVDKKKAGYFNLPLILQTPIKIGDGLSFGEEGKYGCRVDRIFSPRGRSLESSEGEREVLIPYKGVVQAGMAVYRNLDLELMKDLREEALKPLSKPKIDIQVQIHKGAAVTIVMENKEKHRSYQSTIYPQLAEKNPLNEEIISGQFRRLGESDFELGRLQIDCEDGLFLSKSQLNRLRKEALQAFLAEQKLRVTPKPVEIDLKRPLKKSSWQKLSLEFHQQPARGELERIFKASCWAQEKLVIEWVFPLKLNKTDDQIFEAAHKWQEAGVLIKLALPQLMNEEMIGRLKNLRDSGKFNQFDILVSNYEALYCLKDRGLKLEANGSFNVFNSLALKTLKEWGLESAVLSVELSRPEIIRIGEAGIMPVVLPVYGRQQVMVSKNSLFDGPDNQETMAYLEDRQKFPLIKDERGLTHLYHPQPLFLSTGVFDLPGVSLRIYHHQEKIDKLNDLLEYYLQLMINKKKTRLPAEENWGRFKRGVK